MASATIILPGVWQQQPSERVGLDECHPLFGNIASAGTVFDGIPYDVRADGILTPTGVTGIAVKGGQQHATTGTGSTDVWTLQAGRTLLPAQNAVSLLVRAYSNVISATRKRAIRFANPTNGSLVTLDFGDGSATRLSAGAQVAGGGYPACWATIPPTGTPANILFTRRATAMSVYVDGANATTGTSGSSANNLIGAVNQLYVGNSSSGFPLNGGVSQWVLFNTDLSADWARELHRNPWQIFRARPRVLYFDVAGGGTSTVSNDIADSYQLRATISGDVGDSYALRTNAASDLADGYALRTNASGDLADSYRVRAGITSDLPDSYAVDNASSVSSDISDSYALRSDLSSDLADSFVIDSAANVSSDLGDSYAVRAFVNGDLDDSYALRSVISEDLDDVYSLTLSVGNNLTDSYLMRTGVNIDLDDLYLLRGYVYNNHFDNYEVSGLVTSDLSDLYDFVSLNQSDLDSIADAVWAHPNAVAAHAKLDDILNCCNG